MVVRSWRERQGDLLRDRMTAELEQRRTATRLGLVMRHAKDIIIVADEQMRFVDANQQALDTYGWTQEELLGLTIRDIRAPETSKDSPPTSIESNSRSERSFKRSIAARMARYSLSKAACEGLRSMAGRIGFPSFAISRSARPTRIESRSSGACTALLSEINETIFRASDRDELFEAVCRTVVETGGFVLAWIGWHDAAAQALVPVARSSEVAGYPDRDVIPVGEGADQESLSATAFRLDRTQVCNDILPTENPAWRDEAEPGTSLASVPSHPGKGAAVAVH